MADINNLGELQAASSAGGAYTVAPGTYTLDAILFFSANGTYTHDGTTGDITIDGDDTYFSEVRNSTVSFVGLAVDKRFIFTQGVAKSKSVRSTSAAVAANFTYCDFTEAQTAQGLVVNGDLTGGETVVTCTNCNSYNNAGDGYSILADAATNNATMTLNNCTGYDNPGAVTDGVSAHLITHQVYINGGSYYNNGKAGIAMVGSSRLACYGGTEIYDNGNDAQQGQIFIGTLAAGDNSVSVLEDVHIHYTSGASSGEKNNNALYVADAYCYVRNCVFDATNFIGPTGLVRLRQTSDGYYTAATFINTKLINLVAGAALYAVYLDQGGVEDNSIYASFDNCTFYGDGNGIFWEAAINPVITLSKNIFDLGGATIICVDNDYTNNPLNGNNCFWGNGTTEADYFTNDTGMFKDNDINVDPGFVNAADGDFTPTNPALKLDDNTWIGSVQPSSTAGGYRARYA